MEYKPNEFERELGDAKGQRNEDWKEARAGRFTSSSIGLIMQKGRAKEERFGKGCISYIKRKLAEITTHQVAPEFGSAATDWGIENEHDAIRAFMAETGMVVLPTGFVPYGDYAGGSPDGKIKGKDEIIEVKCPWQSENHVSFMLDGFDGINKDYLWQMQGNMLATGATCCWFISYDPRQVDLPKVVYKKYYRDPEMIEAIQSRIEECVEKLNEMIENLKKDEERTEED